MQFLNERKRKPSKGPHGFGSKREGMLPYISVAVYSVACAEFAVRTIGCKRATIIIRHRKSRSSIG